MNETSKTKGIIEEVTSLLNKLFYFRSRLYVKNHKEIYLHVYV